MEQGTPPGPEHCLLVKPSPPLKRPQLRTTFQGQEWNSSHIRPVTLPDVRRHCASSYRTFFLSPLTGGWMGFFFLTFYLNYVWSSAQIKSVPGGACTITPLNWKIVQVVPCMSYVFYHSFLKVHLSQNFHKPSIPM